jgi:hypothetical protein
MTTGHLSDGPDDRTSILDTGRPSAEPTTRIPAEDVTVATPPPSARTTGGLLGVAAVGSLVAVALGVYGNLHEPRLVSINVAGFSGPQAVKAWLTTLTFALALVQLWSALVMWGRMPGMRATPSWIGGLHRWSGRLAVLATVPVAVHCLYALGFGYSDGRVLVHSLAGCLFYGAFVTKMLVLTRTGLPSWALPVMGGVVFTALAGLWVTASLWFFSVAGLMF